MAEKKIIKKQAIKEVTIEDIEKEFMAVLANVKSNLSEKKFKHRIKKATKVLAHGLDKNKDAVNNTSKTKKAEVKGKTIKKAAKKTAKKIKRPRQ